MNLESFGHLNEVSITLKCSKSNLSRYRIEFEKLVRNFIPQAFMQSLTIHEINCEDDIVEIVYKYKPLVES